eukprot:9135421-Pyramimonas_sp.AAC.1
MCPALAGHRWSVGRATQSAWDPQGSPRLQADSKGYRWGAERGQGSRQRARGVVQTSAKASAKRESWRCLGLSERCDPATGLQERVRADCDRRADCAGAADGAPP